MAKIIKTATEPKSKIAEFQFEIGQSVKWVTFFHDGRTSLQDMHQGKIVKICPVNLHVMDAQGNLWSVDKTEIV